MGNECLICCRYDWPCGCKGKSDIDAEVGKGPSKTPLRQQQTGGYKDENSEWVDNTFSCRWLAQDVTEEQRLFYFILYPIMLISFILGVALLNCDASVIRSERYDDWNCSENGDPCTIPIVLDEDMPAPIYFSYQLVNFYQSHRVYLNSKSDYQLDGAVLDTTGCSPSSSLDGLVIYPCGLLPQSIFTDRFFIDVERDGNITSLCTATNCPRHEEDITWSNYWNLYEQNGTWERTGSWGGLADSKFYTPNEIPSTCTRNSTFLDGTNLQLPYPDNSDLIVWLRTAAKPTFKKPFRVIKDYDLLKDDIVHVNFFRYFEPGEKGEKHFIIETSPCLGPKTVILGSFCLGIFIFSCCIRCFMFVITMTESKPCSFLFD